MVVCTYSYDGEIEPATVHHLVDGWNVNAERATLVVLRLVTLQQFACLLVKRFWDASRDDVRDTDVCLLHDFASKEVTRCLLDGLYKLSVVDG